jgi:hypothetical protein
MRSGPHLKPDEGKTKVNCDSVLLNNYGELEDKYVSNRYGEGELHQRYNAEAADYMKYRELITHFS